MQPLLSVPQVAAQVGKNRTTIWRWVRDGWLQPAGYVGREPVFTQTEVDAVIAAPPPAARRSSPRRAAQPNDAAVTGAAA